MAHAGLTSHAAGLLHHGGDPTAAAATAAPLSGHLGGPAYMSPEVAAGGALDKPVDVYSYGALLWYMMTGVPPYAHLRPAQIVVGLASGELALEWPTGQSCGCVEPTLRKIGAAATRRDPAGRPTFDQIVRALLKATERVAVMAAATVAAAAEGSRATGRSRHDNGTRGSSQRQHGAAAAGPAAASGMVASASAPARPPPPPQQQQQRQQHASATTAPPPGFCILPPAAFLLGPYGSAAAAAAAAATGPSAVATVAAATAPAAATSAPTVATAAASYDA